MNPTTLAERLAEGKVPPAEALRYAMNVAEQLRRMHDEGRIHGAVCPANVALTGTAVELVNSAPDDAKLPYAAPEVLQGSAPDARSDLFSFGALLYEVLTGRHPFEGTARNTPASSGSPAVDRVAMACMAEPGARPQRVQKVMLELKMLLVTAQRAATPAAKAGDAQTAAILRGEIQQLENRLAERLASNEQALAELRQQASEAATVAAMQTELQQLDARVTARLQANERSMTEMQRIATEALAQSTKADNVSHADLLALEARMAARIAEHQNTTIEAVQSVRSELAELSGRLEVVAAGDPGRIQQFEGGLDGLRKQVGELHDLVAEDLLNFEKTLKSHSGAIDSARTAMAQTDDLVERVVEALETLQTAVLDQSEDRVMALN